MVDKEGKGFKLQRDIRDNSIDIQRYLEDLTNWEEEMKKKDETFMRNRNFKTSFDAPENDYKQALIEMREKQLLYSIELKELGNQMVKEKKWAEAIEQYTYALQNDDKNPVFYANRALCFLKLNELESAEEDCNMCIKYDPLYLKAYLRRAVARKEMGNLKGSKDDLTFVISKQPSNTFAQTEFDHITSLLEVITDSNENTCVGQMLPNSSQEPLHSSTKKCESIEPIMKQPHERSKEPLRNISIIDIVDFINPASTSCDTGSSSSTKNKSINHITKVSTDEIVKSGPMTYAKFIDVWRSIKDDNTRCYTFLKTINGYNFPTIFKESLDSEILSQILSVLLSKFVPAKENVLSYINGLTRVERFQVLTLFLDDSDKKCIDKLIQYCLDHEECSEQHAYFLRKTYELK